MTLQFSMSSAEVAPDAVQDDHKLLHKEGKITKFVNG